MRVGKKPKTVAPKKYKIRDCVVRISKMKNLPMQKTKTARNIKSVKKIESTSNIIVRTPRSIGATPLKKRFTTLESATRSALAKSNKLSSASPSSASSSPILTPKQIRGQISKNNSINTGEIPSTKAMPRIPKMVAKKAAKTPKPVVDVAGDIDSPATVAAGRSRRAIKPNPKYASEDMVTPKTMKHAANTTYTPKNQKNSFYSTKNRNKDSDSSSDDFFNRESSDELDELPTKSSYGSGAIMSSHAKQRNDDSDFELDEIQESTKKRLKTKRSEVFPTPTNRLQGSGSNALSSESSSARLLSKPMPSQLQQLRRSLNASAGSLLDNRKRKLEIGNQEGKTSGPTLAKRMAFSSTPLNRKISLGQGLMPNGNRNTSTLLSSDKRIRLSMTPKSTTSAQNDPIVKLQNQSGNSKGGLLNKGRSASPLTRVSHTTLKATHTTLKASHTTLKASHTTLKASHTTLKASHTTPKPTPSSVKDKTSSNNDNSRRSESPSNVEDFETMPTFTIVNIHDIINKKGDVLISKAPTKQQAENTAPLKTTTPQQNSKNLATKSKPIEKQPSGKQALSARSSPQDKSSPRILNAMVARKTPPVKPVIANLDDSTEDDDDDDDDQLPLTKPPKGGLSTLKRTLGEEKIRKSAVQQNSATSGQQSAKKSAAVENNSLLNKKRTTLVRTGSDDKKRPGSVEPLTSAKENSPGTTNRIQSHSSAESSLANKSLASPTKASAANSPLLPLSKGGLDSSHKGSPEKVTISRDGDKIVKKITCFETWYVINIVEDRPVRPVRNSLELPLIDLANGIPSINLPSDEWSSKVTLIELSSSALANVTDFVEYTGDLSSHKIPEEDRHKYQPSCVLFRRSYKNRPQSRLPYDRAVIFKNKTFFYNMEGKTVRLVGAPTTITQLEEVETLLDIVDSLSLKNDLVEQTQPGGT